ncbi:MAG: FadR family transcriptional regulator [Alphaproteobacteria bacterium]|nr:FadR family transcriptional regulator [Alphaproteobacteria bacterium]
MAELRRARGSRTFSRLSLHGRVAHDLGLRVLRGELPPGTTLPTEEAFSAELGVSRTALREAIKLLTSKGLLESRPRRGTRVRAREHWSYLDPDVLAWRFDTEPMERSVRDLFELRRLVEPAAAEMAAQRADKDAIKRLEQAYADMDAAGDDGERWEEPDLRFHQTIINTTGNELIGALAALIETTLTMTFRLSNDNPAGQRHSLPLHRAVLDGIRRRKPQWARDAMMVLLDGAEQDVHRALAVRQARRPVGR